MLCEHHKTVSGFSLIQISILLTVASLIMVTVLPSSQSPLRQNANSVSKMQAILTSLRQYQVANGTLPCPADPTQPIGSNTYGVAAANSGSTGNCVGGSPAAAYADSTNHIAIGMIPVRALQLPDAAALDDWERNITYAVDTNATGCWSAPSLSGAITVNDNGNIHNSVAALVSHGQDGYGAWLPLQGTSGTASRFNSGSTDANQADNAQVAHGGGLTANTSFVSFINKTATSTFDDNMVYKSSQWNINALPLRNGVPGITAPANGTYSTGNTLTFTITFPNTVMVTGTPRLALSALGTGKLGNGVSPYISYATYAGGSGTNTLTFSYTVQAGDSAPTSGIAVTAPIDLNGGTISGSTCFFPPNLSQVLIGGTLWVADFCNNRVLNLTTGGSFIHGFGSGYNGDAHTVGTSGSGNYQLYNPAAAVTDSSGNIWIADAGNNRIVEYNSSGQFVRTIGSSGSGNGQFSVGADIPQQVNFDINGNLWATDFYNNRVQEFNSSTGAYMSKFAVASRPAGIAIDSSNTIWVVSVNGGHLQKCTTGGSCTTINTVTFSGGSASDYVSIDATTGNIWVNDQSSGSIHKFSSSGSYLSDLTGAWSNPEGVFYDSSGNIWIADNNANTVDKVNPSTGTITQTIGSGTGTGTSPVQFGGCPQNLFIPSR
jgi:streptogramin lyase